MKKAIQPGLYKHYKGTKYRVVGTARDATNGPLEGQTLVLYISDAGHTYAREIGQFLGTVYDHNEYKPRFQRIGD